MNSETLKALEGSIKKWEKIVESTEEKDRGVENCPLCRLFYNDFSEDEDCMGCPVKEKTGMYGCIGSPYQDWKNHYKNSHGVEFGEGTSRHKDCPECLRLAKAELEFLRGLLPREELAAKE